MDRGCGVLLHISSLPSKYGIGTFGKEARNFISYLKLAGQKYWQMLPLNPTGFGDSPYQSPSAFALNPYFIDLEILIKHGYLTKEEINLHIKKSNKDYVDFDYIYKTRFIVLNIAYGRAFKLDHKLILSFYRKNKSWLRDYALYQVIKELHKGQSWLFWDNDLKLHKKQAIDRIETEYNHQFYFHVTMQYFAFSQFKKLKRYANNHGISLIGDLPIYVALDSSDVWSKRQQFQFGAKCRPKMVAGVPPDYFSATGQLWGNPLYDFEKMKRNDFRWWKERIKHASKLFDVVRIDHFRGFASYYAIPSSAENAINGEWKKGPGKAIIDAMKNGAPKLQIIAEDLGIIGEDVRELLNYSGFPGLKVFQFAFDAGDDDDAFLPHTYEQNCVAYLGTHDNDVMTNFIKDKVYADAMKKYLNLVGDVEIIDRAIESLMYSKADVIILQLQDLLKLPASSRMNTPGTTVNNWIFRIKREELSKIRAAWIYQMACQTKRY